MPLGMEVDFDPGHIVLDGTQLPSERSTAAPPIFGHGPPSQLLLSSCSISDGLRLVGFYVEIDERSEQLLVTIVVS